MSWGRPDAISTVAPTGIAAVLINGETEHSKFLIQSRSISRKKEREEINKWSRIYMLIWDEISMTGQALFSKAYKTMCRFPCTAPDDDPRVHIITAGDFTQLPPVFQKFVFEAPQLGVDKNENFETESKIFRRRSIDADQITGFILWRTFQIVVKLTETNA